MDDIRDIKPVQPIWPRPSAKRPTPNRHRREDLTHRPQSERRKREETPAEGRPRIDEYA